MAKGPFNFISLQARPGRQWGNEAFPAFSHVQNLRLWHFFSRSEAAVVLQLLSHTESHTLPNTHTHTHVVIHPLKHTSTDASHIIYYIFRRYTLTCLVSVLFERIFHLISNLETLESKLRIRFHTRRRRVALRCSFITCVHRRRRTETETYFWTLHSRRALASSIIRMRRPRVRVVGGSRVSALVSVVFVSHHFGQCTRPRQYRLLNSPHSLALMGAICGSLNSHSLSLSLQASSTGTVLDLDVSQLFIMLGKVVSGSLRDWKIIKVDFSLNTKYYLKIN